MSLLQLHPPIPTLDLAFEHVWRGDQTALIALSRARLELAAAATKLVVCDADNEHAAHYALKTAALYFTLWKRHWSEQLLFVGGSNVRTRLPVEFGWRVAIFGPTAHGSRNYVDASPLLETACATLALVAAHQRVAILPSLSKEDALKHLAKAQTILKWCTTTVLTLFRARMAVPPARIESATLVTLLAHPDRLNTAIGQRAREPRVLSTFFCTAVATTLHGHQLQVQAKCTTDRPTVVLLLFQSAAQFRAAAALLPCEPSLQHCTTRVSASAYRILAETLLVQTQHAGAAVACANEAVLLDAANTAHAQYAVELQRRNETEFGFQTVPSRANLHLDFSATTATIIVRDEDQGHVRIIVPKGAMSPL